MRFTVEIKRRRPRRAPFASENAARAAAKKAGARVVEVVYSRRGARVQIVGPDGLPATLRVAVER